MFDDGPYANESEEEFCRGLCANTCPKCGSLERFQKGETVDNGVGEQQCSPDYCEACGYVQPSPAEALAELTMAAREAGVGQVTF